VVDLADELADMLRIAMFSTGISNLQSLKGTTALQPSGAQA
jgi:isopentenyl diphosphate isomerase/L-lactate dehydrogenase-like FMN-dependent dehydrogenase